ncbi:MAG TPA: helix-turn-helix domain-containing protein [Streptosporangiaceae bacterium]
MLGARSWHPGGAMGEAPQQPASTGRPAGAGHLAGAGQAEVARLAAGVAASVPDLVPAAVEAIWQQVPAYAASQDDQLRADVGVHVDAVFRVFLDGLAAHREASRADFAITREQATRRVAQGISLADFLQAFRIGQLTLWQGILAAAGDDPAARDGALSVVARLMQVIELGSTVAGEAYVQAQQHALAEGDRVRRDLLEDLLARRGALAGPGRAMLRAAGLGPDRRLLVATAAPAGDEETEPGAGAARGRAGEPDLADVAAALRGAFGGHGLGLTVARHDEIVAIAPLPRGRADPAISGLSRVCAELAREGVHLAVGVSTVHAGLHEVPEAYAEARVARDGLGTGAGVLALPLLTSFDYLVLRDDETARRLIRPEVRQFVAEDAAAGGALIATLAAYAACDLNARTAARQLHLHVNTAYYRLDRIAERTGCDLRRFADVMELLIAVRLLGAPAAGVAPPAPVPGIS